MGRLENYRDGDSESESAQGLLSQVHPYLSYFREDNSKRHKKPRIYWTIYFGVLQVMLLSIYTAAFVYLRPTAERKSVVYSPALPAVEYEALRYNATLIIDSPWNGPPSEQVDQAWSDLLNNMNVAVHKSDLRLIDTHSIPIPGQKDMYFAGLGVFHELHCLKRLRQYTWMDHYFPDLNEEEKHLNRLHTDHCLEILRQASMCHGDTSLFTIVWKEDSRYPSADFSQEHECANFEKINAWAAEHRVDPSQPGLLVHPKFGVAYREGEYSRIGATLDKSKVIITD